jgi:hypothetical protein
MPVMMVAGLYNFITSLGKLMASQQVFIAISRIQVPLAADRNVNNL